MDAHAKKTDTAASPEGWGRRVVRESETLSTGLPKKGTQKGSPFLYKFKQNRWMWVDEREKWYLNLGFIVLTPGAGGMSSAKGSWMDAVREAERKHWHAIRWEDDRLGKYQNYCASYPLAGGGKQFVSMFHHPDVMADENEWIRDDDAYYEFLDHLVESGIAQPRTERMCRLPIRKQESRVSRVLQDLSNNPGSKLFEARYRVETKKLARMTGRDVDDALEAAEMTIENARIQGSAVERSDG